MNLYNFVVYIIDSLLGRLLFAEGSGVFMLYPSTTVSSLNWDYNYVATRGGFLYQKWQSLLQNNFDENFWWKFLSDPKLVASTIIWLVCIWITVELCLILPWRWFKRLLRFPNARLQTPSEVRRMRRK